jgi:hypothetical protein
MLLLLFTFCLSIRHTRSKQRKSRKYTAEGALEERDSLREKQDPVKKKEAMAIEPDSRS